MKKIILILLLLFSIINTTYALPIPALIIGYDIIFIVISNIISLILILFFYFKNMKFIYKIIIVIVFINIVFLGNYFYRDYKINKIIDDYVLDLNNLGLYDSYYDYGYLVDNYDESIDKEVFLENIDDYYLIDMRELSENDVNIDLDFHRIRFPDLIQNTGKLLNNIEKTIVVFCVDGNRGRVVSSYLGNKGYESYYFEGGFNELLEKYEQKVDINQELIYECNGGINKGIYIGLNNNYNNKYIINIPYLQLTNDDTVYVINRLVDEGFFKKTDKIALLCDENKVLNCGVGRQSIGIILKSLGFNNICLGNNIFSE